MRVPVSLDISSKPLKHNKVKLSQTLKHKVKFSYRFTDFFPYRFWDEYSTAAAMDSPMTSVTMGRSGARSRKSCK
jgi:hypothetical protein